MNRSIPSGTKLEFINVTSVSPMISKCEIKILYTGKNRNRSFISKEVGNKIGSTVRGIPIVGEYFYETEDFNDHGQEELVIDKHGLRFVKSTVPYGFVANDARVWWANFLDYDGVTREYLVTEGYLWTGRYPDCKRVIENGNHQSMEFDKETLVGEWMNIKGEWTKFENDEEEYFNISDAILSALCILGEEIEPCFEGANITKNSQLVYSLNKDDFKEKMLDFMLDLKEALNEEGGIGMLDTNTNVEDTTVVEVPVVAETEPVVENSTTETEPVVTEPVIENQEATPAVEPEVEPTTEEFKKKKENEDDENNTEDNEDDEEKKKKNCKYSLEEVVEYQDLLTKFNELQGQYDLINNELTTIKSEYQELKEFKNTKLDEEKDTMINSFYMLSQEDKKEVMDNKANYSLDEIEAKLSIICVRNKVNFNLDSTSENDNNTEAPITTFNVDTTYNSTPSWLKAVDRVAKNRK